MLYLFLDVEQNFGTFCTCVLSAYLRRRCIYRRPDEILQERKPYSNTLRRRSIRRVMCLLHFVFKSILYELLSNVTEYFDKPSGSALPSHFYRLSVTNKVTQTGCDYAYAEGRELKTLLILCFYNYP
ncbi:hypothetical protein PHET_11186 [Paragonimus heterotremus]|uniref:Uncharacterized protein n=1 Tax=Paragonimus heterotremus TaxID=100268 RepID=A0A8J4SG03_9TREM|nr:hypothetical protein PHET_11186 [Paragonimus heterotremus]